MQKIVLGDVPNSEDSGTGIFHTQNPETGEDTLDITYREGVQGEELVAGEVRGSAEVPKEVYDELEYDKPLLEAIAQSPADVEFTREKGKLWYLHL